MTALDADLSITFQVNPTQISRTIGVNLAENQAPGAPDAHRQYVGGAPRAITFDLILDHNRGDVPEAMTALEQTTEPVGGDSMFRSAPRIALAIGPRVWEGYVKAANLREERFDHDLKTVFARVNVTFQVDQGL